MIMITLVNDVFTLKKNLKAHKNIVDIIRWWNTVDNDASIVYFYALWQWNVAKLVKTSSEL